jgi:D-aminopeptidase
VHAALDSATSEVPEGNVGGGTGMICHDFKGGTGTASRVAESGWTVGALVQANYGSRERLTVAGVPVGEEIPIAEVSSAWDDADALAGSGSIIVVMGTDAPLLPHQCERLAQRASLGIARAGGAGEHSSGDLFIAFATGNAGRLRTYKADRDPTPVDVTMLPDNEISGLFWAAIEATEEAILNALVAAETLTGRDGITAKALPHDRLVEIMTRYGRGPAHG